MECSKKMYLSKEEHSLHRNLMNNLTRERKVEKQDFQVNMKEIRHDNINDGSMVPLCNSLC